MARRDPSGSVFYYFSDHLGTASVVTNATGTIVEESDYYPFGGERVITNSDPNPYKFTGKERDAESGLDYFGLRHYSPPLGRFIQSDLPFEDWEFENPQSLNLYGYVRNNPLRMVDPDGRGASEVVKGLAEGTANFVTNTAKAVAYTAYATSPVGGLTGASQELVSATVDYVATGVEAYQENWGAGVVEGVLAHDPLNKKGEETIHLLEK